MGEQLRCLFISAYVAYTPRTQPQLIKRLQSEGYGTIKAGSTVVSAYQAALRRPLNDEDNILYCDFDRALHWIKNYPDELKALAQSPLDNDYILIGRTSRAFLTHPETQVTTERIGNIVASKTLGFTETRDILGTTWIMTPEMASMILRREAVNKFGFYTDWPMTLWRSAKKPLYLEREGLEWETPDRYQDEIRSQGYEKWRTGYQTAQEWRKRVEMLKDFIESSSMSPVKS